MSVSLCLIVWNELEGCKKDVPLIPRECFDEIYAVDGGSTDGTIEYLESQSIKVFPQSKRGLNVAYIDASNNSKCDNVVVFFPKGTIDPAFLKDFIPKIEENYELIVASRNMKGGRNEEDEHLFRPRKWFVTSLALCAMILWKREGKPIWDVLHGIKAFNNKAFKKMDILDYGVSIDIEMVARAYKKRIPRCEIPVQEFAREYGETHFKAFATGKKLLKYMLFEIFRRN
jgi:glycosyltransferase involved in cell wall biosynthesis